MGETSVGWIVIWVKRSIIGWNVNWVKRYWVKRYFNLKLGETFWVKCDWVKRDWANCYHNHCATQSSSITMDVKETVIFHSKTDYSNSETPRAVNPPRMFSSLKDKQVFFKFFFILMINPNLNSQIKVCFKIQFFSRNLRIRDYNERWFSMATLKWEI